MDEAKAWDAVAGFLTGQALEKGLSEKTCEAYRNDLGNLIDFCVQRSITDWDDVTPLDITRFIGELYDLGISPATVNRRLSAYRGFFSYLAREGILKTNPAKLVTGPRAGRKLPHILSPENISAILEQPDNSTPAGLRDRAILELMYGCGLRVSEVIAVRLESFVLEGKLLAVTGKGEKQRLVPIGGMAQKAVVDYLSQGRPRLVREPRKAGSFLFLSVKLGKPVSRQAVWLMIKKYTREANPELNVTPHTFRHSFATHLLEGGAGLRDVQAMLGHVSIDTTMIYTHIDRSHLIEVVRTFHPRS